MLKTLILKFPVVFSSESGILVWRLINVLVPTPDGAISNHADGAE